MNKLRDYKIKKGRKFPIANLWIEKSGYRIDTSGEKRGLGIAQYSAELRKRTLGLPVRKTKGKQRSQPKNKGRVFRL